MKIDVNPSDVIGIALKKFIEYKDIEVTDEEVKKFVKLLFNDEEFNDAISKIIKITNK